MSLPAILFLVILVSIMLYWYDPSRSILSLVSPEETETYSNYASLPDKISSNNNSLQIKNNYTVFSQDLQPLVEKTCKDIECPEMLSLPRCQYQNPPFNSPYLINKTISSPIVTPSIPDQSNVSSWKPTCSHSQSPVNYVK